MMNSVNSASARITDVSLAPAMAPANNSGSFCDWLSLQARNWSFAVPIRFRISPMPPCAMIKSYVHTVQNVQMLDYRKLSRIFGLKLLSNSCFLSNARLGHLTIVHETTRSYHINIHQHRPAHQQQPAHRAVSGCYILHPHARVHTVQYAVLPYSTEGVWQYG